MPNGGDMALPSSVRQVMQSTKAKKAVECVKNAKTSTKVLAGAGLVALAVGGVVASKKRASKRR